ncbi:MAG: DUF4296 domain-containing protein [Bacteroidales bacterium]|nr:DUF4296 domain-containing protein [Bacteroidales bacterium]
MKTIQKSLTIILLAIAVAMAGCNRDSVPAGIMTEEEMIDFLSEAYLIEGFYAIETGYNYDKLTDDIVNSYRELLDRKGLSQQKFEKSIEYYMRHSDRYERVHQAVVDRLDAMQPDKARGSASPQNRLPR